MTDDEIIDPAEDQHALLADCAQEPATDIGNGRRFRRRHGDLAREGEFKSIRVAHIGWHVFDGARWKEDQEDSAVRPLAHQAAEAIGDEALLIRPTEKEQELMDGANAAEMALNEMRDQDTKSDDMFARQRADMQKAIEDGAEAKAAWQGRRRARRKWGKDSCSRGKIDAMLSEAAPYVTRLVDDLNTNRLAVNCRSGTIHFVDREIDGEQVWYADLREHDDADMITKMCEASWYPAGEKHLYRGRAIEPADYPEGYNAACPVFANFLEKVLPPDIVDFLQRFFGYCLLGLTGEQVLLFFYGIGRNGKSTFMEVVCRVLGDYAVTLAIESFSGEHQRGGGDATPDLARLPGARLVSTSEPQQGIRLKEGMIKALTGGEKFPVRRLRKEFFEIDPQFKMVISGNHKPVVTDDSDGTWRRLLLVPWDVQIPKGEVDRALPEKLRREADGIFAWLVDGALGYLSQGLDVPETISSASKEYREESDPIEGFILAACEVTGDPTHTEKTLDLFTAYEKWCHQTGAFPYKREIFARRMPNKAGRPYATAEGKMQTFGKSKTGGLMIYRGIRIRDEYLPHHKGDQGDEE